MKPKIPADLFLALAEALTRHGPNSRQYKKLQKSLDELLGMPSEPADEGFEREQDRELEAD